MNAAARVRAFVGLGSNIGDSRATLALAFDALRALPDTTLVRQSQLYRTPPWGLTAQPDFLNAVAQLDTALDAPALLAHLRRIEHDAGRQRIERWGPRSLDLDLLLHGDTRSDTAQLQLPHPRMHERAFVLVPLAELAPTLQLGAHGRVDALLADLDTGGIEAVP